MGITTPSIRNRSTLMFAQLSLARLRPKSRLLTVVPPLLAIMAAGCSTLAFDSAGRRVEPPVVTLPDFPQDAILPSDPAGYLEGTSGVSPTGEFAYRMALAVPKGRLRVQPNLSLEYQSRGSNGLLGVGFRLGGLSEIRRCGKSLAANGEADGIDH